MSARNRPHLLGLCASLLAAVAVAMPARATVYSLVAIDELGQGSSGVAINDRGDVVGTSCGRSFVYRSGVKIDLGLLAPDWPSAIAHATGINATGEISGTATFVEDGGWYMRAFRHSGTTISRIGPIGGFHQPGGFWSYGQGINDHGAVVGRSFGGQTFIDDAGGFRFLDAFGGAKSQGHAINNAGQIVGTVQVESGYKPDLAYLYDPLAGVRHLGVLDGATFTIPWALNERGTVVGGSTSSPYAAIGGPGSRAFIYRDGDLQDLGRVGGAYSFWSFAYGLNEAEEVVGAAFINGVQGGFVHTGGRMYDLNTLLDGSSGEGWRIHEARDINNLGQIVASGIRNGRLHAVVLTPCEACSTRPLPVPEPASVALWGLGLLVLAAVPRRKRRALAEAAVSGPERPTPRPAP